MRDFLWVLDILFSTFCTMVLIFLAGILSALLIVTPTGRNDLDGLFGVATLFAGLVYFPLTLFLITAIDCYFPKEKIGAMREKLKRKMSERQIKAARAERVSGSLSLSESLGSGNLSFVVNQGALSLTKKMGGSS